MPHCWTTFPVISFTFIAPTRCILWEVWMWKQPISWWNILKVLRCLHFETPEKHFCVRLLTLSWLCDQRTNRVCDSATPKAWLRFYLVLGHSFLEHWAAERSIIMRWQWGAGCTEWPCSGIPPDTPIWGCNNSWPASSPRRATVSQPQLLASLKLKKPFDSTQLIPVDIQNYDWSWHSDGCVFILLSF